MEIYDGTPQTNSHWKNVGKEKPIITVDFDHTITKKCLECVDGFKDDDIQFGCAEALQELSKRYQIWIFTGSYDYVPELKGKGRTVEDIEKFLKDHKIPFDKVLQTKPPACFMIDDRAVFHKGWILTLKEIETRENQNEFFLWKRKP